MLDNKASRITVLTAEETQSRVKDLWSKRGPVAVAMYSSWLNAITLDSSAMTIPLDDHMVHRGDGVFEAIKFDAGAVFALREHLDRLKKSAEKIELKMPWASPELTSIVLETVRASGLSAGIIRIFVSRGPGGFSPNPYDCPVAHLYVAVLALKPVKPEWLHRGASCTLSTIPIKEGFFSTVKSCNYLPNVLMKKEAVDRGFDFSINIDDNGVLGEGSTENFAFVTKNKDLIVPPFHRTLRGITVSRMMLLAEDCVSKGLLRSVKNAQVRLADLSEMSEMMAVGTTLDVVPICMLDDQRFALGEVAKELRALLLRDIATGPLRTLLG